MLKNLKNYYRPASLAAGLALLKKGKGTIIPIGGATTLAVLDSPRVEGVVDVTTLGLDYVKQDRNELRIGAGTTISGIIESKPGQKYLGGFLVQSGLTIGSTLNRNMITVGGNLYQLYLWSCLPVALLALDGTITLRKAGKKRTLAAAEFFATNPRQTVGSDELITEIAFPVKALAGARGKFSKFSKTATGYPMVSVAAAVRVKSGKLDRLQVAVGALQTLPQRFPEIERRFLGQALTETTAAEFAAAVATAAAIVKELRASVEFKRRVAEEMIRETLVELAG